MKVTLIGPYPPVVGGISMHLKRLKNNLEKNRTECKVYNENKWADLSQNIYNVESYKKLILDLIFDKSNILHFHTIDKKMRMIMSIYKIFRKKVILTVHGDSLIDQIENSGYISKKLFILSLKNIDKIICVNPKTEKDLIDLGFEKSKLKVIPAHIHPAESLEEEKKIPAHVYDFMKKSEFLISANGCIRFYNNEDLYGVDLLIHLIERLLNKGIKAQLLFALLDKDKQGPKENQYYQQLKDKIKELGLEDSILFYEVNNTEFYPILKESKMFIRPTNTDGYGVSISEAIYYDVPSLASDVCRRPEGTELFKSRDLLELTNKVVDVYRHYDEYLVKVKKIEPIDYAKELFKVYEDLH